MRAWSVRWETRLHACMAASRVKRHTHALLGYINHQKEKRAWVIGLYQPVISARCFAPAKIHSLVGKRTKQNKKITSTQPRSYARVEAMVTYPRRPYRVAEVDDVVEVVVCRFPQIGVTPQPQEDVQSLEDPHDRASHVQRLRGIHTYGRSVTVSNV
jgi:hypothetical protein